MHTETISYSLEHLEFQGYIAYDPASTPLPVVLVTPTWMGLNDFIREKTQALAKLGYLGFAIDLFGNGHVADSPEQARQLVDPFIKNPKQIALRMQAALKKAKQLPQANPQKVGAIGFCFGGRCVLELARSGAEFQAAISFHASFNHPKMVIQTPKAADKIHPSILILHGDQDPLAPLEKLQTLQREMTQRSVDWQTVVFGETMHAFTNPKANLPEKGLQYHEKNALRSWKYMTDFLIEAFE